MAEYLKDIISLQDVKLVIELDDADRSPDAITKTFVITKEVESSLDVILDRIVNLKGCGAFIKGNYGSGKSHFLSYLYLLLSKKNLSALEKYPALKKLDINTIKVSLVKYPSNYSLEKIILSVFEFEGDIFNRDETFNKLIDKPTVIIIDELSEFLRSKPDNSSFYEDIRFLQFLGEFSFASPLFIIASLQEWIEETGHISSSIFNRIKDRYPLRLSLSSSHVEDIIDQRIIIKKETAIDVIKGVFSGLKEYYPHLSMRFDDFRKTYPLNPFTVRFLSGLTPIFSQHRGVIQFVFNEVKKVLNEKVDFLLTPEFIFDHFEDRIREIPEYSPLVTIVYDYYKAHLKEILPQDASREIGLSVIKLLILTEISPFEKRKTSNEIAEILLRKISTLTSQINYEFIKNGVLDPLANHKMYIERDGESYYVDIKSDERIEIKGRLKALREKYKDRGHLFSEICNVISLPYLPLKDIKEGRKYKFLWQNSLRECVVFISNTQGLKNDEIRKIINTLETRLDGYLILLSPFSKYDSLIDSIKGGISSSFLCSLIFWIPGEFTEEEILFVEEYIAKIGLLSDFPDIKEEIKSGEAEFKEIITRVFFDGEIYYASGEKEDNIKEIGYLPIEKLLSHLFDFSLTTVHPNHSRIMPRLDYYSSHNLNSLFNYFIKNGKITIEEAERKGVIKYIQGLVEPLGIIKKKGTGFVISLDAENELVSHVLNLAIQEQNAFNLKSALKRGIWGMEEAQINLLISAFIASGHLIPYRNDDITDLSDLQQLYTGEINKLKPGKTLEPELLGYLHYGRFIWGDVEDIPTPLTQKKMWSDAVVIIKKGKRYLSEVNAFYDRYKEYTILKRLSINFSLFNRLSMFFNSMSFSLAPSDGITRILAYLKEDKNLEDEFVYLERVYVFFSENFQTVNKYLVYLSHNSLKLNSELAEKRELIFACIEGIFQVERDDFNLLKSRWDDFFIRFTETYKESHDAYYSAAVFNIRAKTEESDAFQTLKRISNIITSVTFDNDFWEVKRELERLPRRCSEDLNYELFINPVCRCGFKIGNEPPLIEIDLTKRCEEGIYNFLRFINLSVSREKLDSYLLSLTDTGEAKLAKSVSSLLSLDFDSSNLSLIYPLLNDEVLSAIERALKGRWKLKEVRVKDFFEEIRGRRLKYNELKDIFLKWAGSDEESIVWIRDEEDKSSSFLCEALKKYGTQGERILRELGAQESPVIEGYLKDEEITKIERDLEGEGKLKLIEEIKFSNFSIKELFELLDQEKLKNLKRLLRDEIFFRLWGKIINKSNIDSTKDETMRDVLKILRLFREDGKHEGVDLFTKTIAPLNHLIKKLTYENGIETKIGEDTIKKIEEHYAVTFKAFNRLDNRLDGCEDINYLKSMLNGVVVILDGLRYDLWLIFKKVLVNEGFKIKERVYYIDTPATTDNFRSSMGIVEEGLINDKKYALLKFAERDIGRRRIKNFLKNDAPLKFLHFNFIDSKVHNSTLDLHPLFILLKDEFISGILPALKEVPPFYLISDHGFTDTGSLKNRYTHGKGSVWETILPVACVN